MASGPPPIDTSPIARGGISATPHLLSASQVAALRADAADLFAAGAFVPGGLRRRSADDGATSKGNGKDNGGTGSKRQRRAESGMQTTTDDATRICDVCGLFDDAESAPSHVGHRDAREDLFDLMADLRELLQCELDVRLSEGMELQYLRYPGMSDGNDARSGKRGSSDNDGSKGKGFYRRHFDSAHDDRATCRRRISLLLYLNEGDWDGNKDGGVLRAYVRSRSKKKGESGSGDGDARECASVQDVVPEGGKLVLFDSKSVEHEVLPTRRERWAVVGWFLGEEKDRSAGKGSSTGRKRSESSNLSGEQTRKRKKKKRRRNNRT